SASLDARPERKRLERLDPRWRWFSVRGARQRWRDFGRYGVDERRTAARRAEHRNDTGARLSPLVADRDLDLSSRTPPAQHADLYIDRAGSDLTGEHGRTGTQELSWIADFQAGRSQRQRCHYPALRDRDNVLEAPHGTELARYRSPGASEISITPQRGIRADTEPGAQDSRDHSRPRRGHDRRRCADQRGLSGARTPAPAGRRGPRRTCAPRSGRPCR